jgi:hypothetical protein
MINGCNETRKLNLPRVHSTARRYQAVMRTCTGATALTWDDYVAAPAQSTSDKQLRSEDFHLFGLYHLERNKHYTKRSWHSVEQQVKEPVQ